ncbi:hypothetical protein GCM10008927_09730 [Amylibacter ulvae]|uniref:DUF4177 domain-containing protein n=2 Tax=Paramylibacter ulvae TaxID=1651968 RepID=A0ABQ3CXD3_9RHOB|nr:hypothetical protein GCM10008927_09730 [Amylibacter ulvae]
MRHLLGMKYKTSIIAIATSIALMAPMAASAACYADYKAKRAGEDLRLHYGVIELSDNLCGNPNAAKRTIENRVARDGWTVLRVMSTFDESGLGPRRKDAGEYFLKY